MSDKSVLDGIPVHEKGFPLRDMVQPPVPATPPSTCPKCGSERRDVESVGGGSGYYFPCDCFKQAKSLQDLTKSK